MKMVFVLLSAIITSHAYALSYQAFGFNTVDQNVYKVQDNSKLEVTTPPLMSQDTLGICYVYPTSTLLTVENCRTLKEDCSKVGPEKIFSPLGLAPYGRGSEGSSKNSSKKVEDEDLLPGGNTVGALNDVINENAGWSPSEKCTSLDRVLSKVGGASAGTEVQLHLWQRLQNLYLKSKDLSKDCAECTSEFYATAKDEIEKKFDVKVSNESLLKAFAEKSYGEFFDRLFTPDKCFDKENSAILANRKIQVEYYPQEKEKGTFVASMDKIKATLQNGRPVALGQICTDEKPSATKCSYKHAVTIAGYRKVCDKQNKCREVLKILNSWGKRWQEKNDDGWVDAQTLLDRTFYKTGTLTWLADKS